MCHNCYMLFSVSRCLFILLNLDGEQTLSTARHCSHAEAVSKFLFDLFAELMSLFCCQFMGDVYLISNLSILLPVTHQPFLTSTGMISNSFSGKFRKIHMVMQCTVYRACVGLAQVRPNKSIKDIACNMCTIIIFICCLILSNY